MRAKPVRRFTLLDALVLIAATAVGLAAVRYDLPALGEPSTTFTGPESGWTPWSRAAIAWAFFLFRVVFLSPFLLAPWTLALLALRLRPPRSPLRNLALQPGTAACIAATSGMVVGGLQLLAASIAGWFVMGRNAWAADPNSSDVASRSAATLALYLILRFVLDLENISYCVIMAWLLVAWSRRCRPEPSWLDRSGRILGILWISAASGLWILEQIDTYIIFNTPSQIASPRVSLPPASSPPPASTPGP